MYVCAASSFALFNAGPGPLSFSVDPSSRTVFASLGDEVTVQWGIVTPGFGTIPGQQSVTFTLNASSMLLPPGSFGATVVIHTNQPIVSSAANTSVDQWISWNEGVVFSVPWSVQVVAAIAFPPQVDVTLASLQTATSSLISVANFAGAALVISSPSDVSWLLADDVARVIPPGSVVSFPILISYPLLGDGSAIGPGANLSLNMSVRCWRADVDAVDDSSVTAEQLASLLNGSAAILPRSGFFSPISLNSVTITLSTVVGPPNGTLSTAKLLSAASIPVNVDAGIRIRLSMRDAGGYVVQPSDDVIGLVGLQSQWLNVRDHVDESTNHTELVSVTSIAVSSDNASFIITAEPLVLGSLLLNVTLNGSLASSPIAVTVFSANCGVNETALNGLTCVCSAGHYYYDSSHCLPCLAGTYKPVASNAGQTS